MPPTLQDLQSRHRVYDLVHPCALKFHPNASFQIAEDLLASSQRAGPIISGISDMYSAHICCIDMHMDSNVGAHMCTCRNMFIRSLSAGCDFGTYIITASATISGKVTSKKENTNKQWTAWTASWRSMATPIQYIPLCLFKESDRWFAAKYWSRGIISNSWQIMSALSLDWFGLV